MAPPFILVCPLGGTDVQVVFTREDGQRQRVSLARSSIGPFHSHIESGEVRWHVLPFAETLPLPEGPQQFQLTYDSGRHRLDALLAEAAGFHSVSIAAADSVDLCCHILARTTRAALQLRDDRIVAQPLHVLLLNTRRSPPRDGEPIAAGRVARQPLADALGLATDAISERVFLTEDEPLEIDRLGGWHLRVSAARRIDDALRELAERFADQRPMLVVADVAGMGEIKTTLAAAARYRFGDRVRFIRPLHANASGRRDQANEGESAQQRLARVPPDESLATRRLVGDLLRFGAVEAAARIALPPGAHGSIRQAEPWRDWLVALNELLRGNAHQATELVKDAPPESRILQYVVRLQEIDDPLSVLALRIETALLRRDLLQAVRETHTFDEVAEKYFGGGLLERDDKLLAALDTFAQSMAGPPTRLRNRLTHEGLTADEFHMIEDLFVERGLWTKGPTGFLAVPTVQTMLECAGVQNPIHLYTDLCQAVAFDQDAYSFQ